MLELDVVAKFLEGLVMASQVVRRFHLNANCAVSPCEVLGKTLDFIPEPHGVKGDQHLFYCIPSGAGVDGVDDKVVG